MKLDEFADRVEDLLGKEKAKLVWEHCHSLSALVYDSPSDITNLSYILYRDVAKDLIKLN